MSKQDFINGIAPYVQKWQKAFGFGVCSAIIAQACLESAYGTSDKARHNNFFGLKYKKDRVTCNNGKFTSTSAEWKDGKYYPIVTEWYSFSDMDTGVEGYFQFIQSGRYKVNDITDPEAYLQALKDGGYATSPKYVENNMRVIEENNLRRFDGGTVMKPDSPLARLLINSPTTYGKRPKPADRITIHHMGCFPSPTAEEQCRRFANKSRCASATYCIGNDGDCVQGLLEAYAPCTSSSKANDLRAITFEVANSSGGPDWFISPEAMNTLVFVLADVCKRNGIPKLVWSDDKNERINGLNGANMTLHCDFWSTACPGPFLKKCMKSIADITNSLLVGNNVTPTDGYYIGGDDYSPVFNPEYYAKKYSDLKIAYGDDASKLWEHFQMFGMNEFRQASAEFDPNYYRYAYPDVEEAFGDDNPMYYFHYVVCGKNEGRRGAE